MRCFQVRCNLIISICVIMFWHQEVARGDFVTTLSVDQTVTAGELFQYSYTLTNQPQSDHYVAIFLLDVAADAGLRSITGPIGWDASYASGDTAISWVSSDPSTDLAPGSSAVFSFESLLAPTERDCVIAGFGDEPPIAFNSGRIDSPGASAVPEPSPLLLLGTGTLVILGYASRRRRQSTGSPVVSLGGVPFVT